MASNVVNVVVAGIGGQGVLKASDILADAAFQTGADVKKSEIHGMSQRGGSVTSDVRYGEAVASPMIPEGEADVLVVLEPTQVEVARPRLREGGVLLEPSLLEGRTLPHVRSLNVAMLGALSTHLDLPAEAWRAALRANLPAKVHEVNDAAFALGREAAGA